MPEVLSVTPGAILMVPPLWETVGLMVASTLTLMVPVLTKLSEVPVPMERSNTFTIASCDDNNHVGRRMAALNEKVDKLSKEAEDLAAQATKLEKDNPDLFKS